jgi:hypothetical protein
MKIVFLSLALMLSLNAFAADKPSVATEKKSLASFSYMDVNFADGRFDLEMNKGFKCNPNSCELNRDGRKVTVILSNKKIKTITSVVQYSGNPSSECTSNIDGVKAMLQSKYQATFTPVKVLIYPPALMGYSNTKLDATMLTKDGSINVTASCEAGTLDKTNSPKFDSSSTDYLVTYKINLTNMAAQDIENDFTSK